MSCFSFDVSGRLTRLFFTPECRVEGMKGLKAMKGMKHRRGALKPATGHIRDFLSATARSVCIGTSCGKNFLTQQLVHHRLIRPLREQRRDGIVHSIDNQQLIRPVAEGRFRSVPRFPSSHSRSRREETPS